jgi:hypothetical protein
MKKIKNSEEKNNFFTVFLLFFTVFKTVKKINNFFTVFAACLRRLSDSSRNHKEPREREREKNK